MKIDKLLLALLLTFSTSIAFASGGYGGGGGYSGGSSSAPRATPKDQVYEYGKALYKGRIKAVGKVPMCFKTNEGVVKVKKSTLKPYKASSYQELANQLYLCDQPDQAVSTKLNGKQLGYVIYYLNKRYKLNLTQS